MRRQKAKAAQAVRGQGLESEDERTAADAARDGYFHGAMVYFARPVGVTCEV